MHFMKKLAFGIGALEIRHACLFQEQFSEILIAYCVLSIVQLTLSETEY